jgi:large subunit ribosomal protein L17
MVQHGKKRVKLGRTASHRDAMLANMAIALFMNQKIITTSPKAKALRPLVDRLISTAKLGTLHSQRHVAQTITDKVALKKLFQDIVPLLKDRNSGYSRVVKAGFRKGDGAELSLVELMIERPKEEAPKKEGRLKKLAGKMKRGSTKTEEVKKPARPKRRSKKEQASEESESKA